MALVTVPLNTNPNQSFMVTLPINNKNITLLLEISYKEACSYWVMNVKDPSTKKDILSNLPLITGGLNGKSANILQQYQYLNIGSAFVVKLTDTDLDYPDDSSLGSEFVLVWGDNYDILNDSSN